jgi:hypothetical protein
MPTPAGDDDDQRRFAELSARLAEGVTEALPGWVVGCVERVLVAYEGSAEPTYVDRARLAGERARADVGPRVRELLGRPVDDQTANPLSLVRQATRYPTEILVAAGVPPVARDRRAEELFPDDRYDLAPASFADLDPGLADLGIAWGAAKAHLHRRRHG